MIDVDAGVVVTRGWGRRLAEVFAGVVDVAGPFYAEARLLRGFRALGRHVEREPGETDIDPVNRNLWRGLPNKPAIAVSIGSPYTARWPEMESIGVASGGQMVACPEDLAVPTLAVPAPPRRLAQPFDGHWEWFEHPTPGGGRVPAVTINYPTKTSKEWPF